MATIGTVPTVVWIMPRFAPFRAIWRGYTDKPTNSLSLHQERRKYGEILILIRSTPCAARCAGFSVVGVPWATASVVKISLITQHRIRAHDEPGNLAIFVRGYG